MNKHIMTILLRLIIQKTFRVQVIQDSSLPGGNSIIASNHHNWLDPLLITAFWPLELDLMYIGPRQENANTLWKRWMYDRTPDVILTEHRWGWPGKSAYESVLKGLRSGKTLLIFPEGDAFPEEGDLKPFGNGAAHFALKTGVPIIPVGLCGTADLYYKKTLQMHLGHPIRVKQTECLDRNKLKDLRDDLKGKISGLIRDYQEPQVSSKPMHWLTHLL